VIAISATKGIVHWKWRKSMLGGRVLLNNDASMSPPSNDECIDAFKPLYYGYQRVELCKVLPPTLFSSNSIESVIPTRLAADGGACPRSCLAKFGILGWGIDHCFHNYFISSHTVSFARCPSAHPLLSLSNKT
jgi:hypothetical protein